MAEERGAIDGVSIFMGFRWEAHDTIRLTIRPDLINAGGCSPVRWHTR